MKHIYFFPSSPLLESSSIHEEDRLALNTASQEKTPSTTFSLFEYWLKSTQSQFDEEKLNVLDSVFELGKSVTTSPQVEQDFQSGMFTDATQESILTSTKSSTYSDVSDIVPATVFNPVLQTLVTSSTMNFPMQTPTTSPTLTTDLESSWVFSSTLLTEASGSLETEITPTLDIGGTFITMTPLSLKTVNEDGHLSILISSTIDYISSTEAQITLTKSLGIQGISTQEYLDPSQGSVELSFLWTNSLRSHQPCYLTSATHNVGKISLFRSIFTCQSIHSTQAISKMTGNTSLFGSHNAQRETVAMSYTTADVHLTSQHISNVHIQETQLSTQSSNYHRGTMDSIIITEWITTQFFTVSELLEIPKPFSSTVAHSSGRTTMAMNPIILSGTFSKSVFWDGPIFTKPTSGFHQSNTPHLSSLNAIATSSEPERDCPLTSKSSWSPDLSVEQIQPTASSTVFFGKMNPSCVEH